MQQRRDRRLTLLDYGIDRLSFDVGVVDGQLLVCSFQGDGCDVVAAGESRTA